jgi:hypothetical protein
MTLLIMLIKWVASQVFFFFFFRWVTISQFDWPITRKYKKKTKTLKAYQNRKSM